MIATEIALGHVLDAWPGIDRKTRSMINLTMLSALNTGGSELQAASARGADQWRDARARSRKS